MLEFTKCDSVRPNNVVGDQSSAVSSVQTCLLNLGRSPPVCPVNEAEKKETNLNKVQH